MSLHSKDLPMSNNLPPFNIELFSPTDQDLRNVRPIKVLDIFAPSSRNFHPDGLFSIETFGKVGEERRNRMFSYIDLHVSVFHPIVFRALSDLKSLYADILSGKGYAIFDESIKDFIKSTPVDGNTGFSFFMKHFKELKFEERPSAKREFNIKLINTYRDKCTLNKLIVMPAGLRDYTVDENGKPSEDEVNTLYRKVFSVASFIENVNSKLNSEYLDSARFNLQLSINAIYDYIKNLLEGKSKLILGKWASRKIANSTRNVASSHIPSQQTLFGEKSVNSNQTVVGLYQFLRSILPIAVRELRDGFLSSVFPGPNVPAILVNKKTLKKEIVTIDSEYYDDWMTYEGLEKIMARFEEEDIRHEYLDIGPYYIGLIYKGPDGTYKFLQDIDDVPEGRDKKDVTPITYAELLYTHVFKDSDKVPCFVTRYPITGYGSIYPSYCYLKTTVKSEIRTQLNDNWEVTDNKANEFPIRGYSFYNTVSVSPAHAGRLGLDKVSLVHKLSCPLH